MYNSVPTKFISVPTKSYFFLPGGAGAPPGPLGKYAYGLIIAKPPMGNIQAKFFQI